MGHEVSLHGHGDPEPIGLEYIASSLMRAGFTTTFRGRYELEVGRPGGAHVGSLLSGVTNEWASVERAATEAKARGNLVVVGGYHACGRPEDASPELFDCVVIGEGEEVAPSLLEGMVEGRPVSDRIVHAPQIKDLDALPYPVRQEEFLGIYMLHDLMWPPPSLQKNPAIVLASRGCQYTCDFCASATVWGHGLRRRSPENVVGELRDIKSRFGSDTLVFIDQSLGQHPEWTQALCTAIGEASLGMSWYQQSNLPMGNDVIAALASAGCTKIGFGVEGISPRAIEIMKPQYPHELEAINTAFDYCNSLGVFTKAYLMIGYPWETPEHIAEYLDCIRNLRANQIKISFVTPFPGTKDWERYESQLLTKDWTQFDTVAMPVVANPSISVDQYYAARTALFQAFYGSDTYAEVTRQLLTRYPHYAASYAEFLTYLQVFDMVTGGEKWVNWVRPGGSVYGLAAVPGPEMR